MALNESIGKHEEGMEQGNRIFREDSLDFNCIQDHFKLRGCVHNGIVF